MSLSAALAVPIGIRPVRRRFELLQLVRLGASATLTIFACCAGLYATGRLTLSVLMLLPVVTCAGGALASLGLLLHCLRHLRGAGRLGL